MKRLEENRVRLLDNIIIKSYLIKYIMKLSKRNSRKRIQKRIRKRISGTQSVPRLSVFRSNKNISCQMIDDVNGVTLFSVSSKKVGAGEDSTKIGQAKAVGQALSLIHI